MAPRSVAPKPAKPRAWQRMLSGRRLDLLDPSPFDVEIEDIAHGLARIARWNGQTTGHHIFSVAQHSVLVADIAGRLEPDLAPRWHLAVLLHDAPEYVIGDMISPFKGVIGGDYKAVEARLMAAIHIRFGLPPEAPAEIVALTKRADKVSAFLEATQLAGFGLEEASAIFGAPVGVFGGERGIPPVLVPEDADKAKEAFLARFAMLEARS
ncbi:HD domain-containing protein [Phreatobacter stygius]|uniref:HD family hydrolase n=1 Tax=Phreatobacter stygius TaxID=1940610 RepID=A0A4D7B101_9HYPH|nr:HD family hydrolase [Phreatobacter stygius]QCI66441.1 HD family hydrolase [Phreatobacter stygius]